jgi:hypothetical protein
MSYWFYATVLHCEEHEDCEQLVTKTRRHTPRPEAATERIQHVNTTHEVIEHLRGAKGLKHMTLSKQSVSYEPKLYSAPRRRHGNPYASMATILISDISPRT